MRRKAGEIVRWTLVAAVSALALGCGAATSGQVAFEVPVNARTGSVVEVAISGEDMEGPVVAELEVRHGVARGTVAGVALGESRRVSITARDGEAARCSRETWTDVVEERTSRISLPLLCRSDLAESVVVEDDEPAS